MPAKVLLGNANLSRRSASGRVGYRDERCRSIQSRSIADTGHIEQNHLEKRPPFASTDCANPFWRFRESLNLWSPKMLYLSRPRRICRAFTLVELLVVIGIIAILIGL